MLGSGGAVSYDEYADEAAYREYVDTLCAGCRHPRYRHTDGGIDNGLRKGMPCIAQDPDVADEDRMVACMCLGWWEPGTDCPYERECDRCGSKDDVSRHDNCSACGPVPLCRGCAEFHANELAEGQAYEEHIASMTEEERAVWLQRVKRSDPTAPPDEPYDQQSKGLFQTTESWMGSPVEVVEDPNMPFGGGVIYSEEAFKPKGVPDVSQDFIRTHFGANEPAAESESGILTCSCGSERWSTDVVVEHGSVVEYGTLRCARCSRGRSGHIEIRRSEVERYGLDKVDPDMLIVCPLCGAKTAQSAHHFCPAKENS